MVPRVGQGPQRLVDHLEILEVPSATTNETIPVDLDEVFLSDSPEQLHDVVHLPG
jgi:hypothetical protein